MVMATAGFWSVWYTQKPALERQSASEIDDSDVQVYIKALRREDDLVRMTYACKYVWDAEARYCSTSQGQRGGHLYFYGSSGGDFLGRLKVPSPRTRESETRRSWPMSGQFLKDVSDIVQEGDVEFIPPTGAKYVAYEYGIGPMTRAVPLPE
jgi:hypothetical protein